MGKPFASTTLLIIRPVLRGAPTHLPHAEAPRPVTIRGTIAFLIDGLERLMSASPRTGRIQSH